MDSPRSALLNEVDLKAPWELVEAFSRQPRWRPEDVNRGADMIVARLTALGVPVTVHEPEIYLSIPFEAEVRAAGRVIRAKPPAYSASAPQGVTGEIAYAPAEYSKSIGTLFDKNAKAVAPEQLRGRIVVSEGFAFPHKVRELEALGAIGVIAVNPGADIHWGICTSIWGTPDLDDLPRKPTIPVAAVNNPDGRELIALAGSGAQVTLATRLEEGWYRQKLPVVEIEGGTEPEKFVLLHGHYDSWDVGVGDNATGNATLLEIARVLARHRKRLRRSVRIAWWPGHSTGRYAGSTWYADAFAIDLDENCVAQINCDSPGCRWATQFKDVSWMKETEAFAQRTIKAVTGLDAHGERPHRAGDYSFNNIGISSLMMLSSTMPDALRDEKGYYAVGGCGGNIAWHTDNDTLEIADRGIMLRDIKVYLEIAGGIADAEILPFDWRRSSTSSSKRSTPTSRRPAPPSISTRRKQPAFRLVARLPASMLTSKPAASSPDRQMT
ncbi:MAG TPA: M28 family metallopeptidase [Beijerinckiaceae bacterium]|nr:M28 family metallopeptidase [Beijerinckiaceae bacterium]